jgi:hypothetical protein
MFFQTSTNLMAYSYEIYRDKPIVATRHRIRHFQMISGHPLSSAR